MGSGDVHFSVAMFASCTGIISLPPSQRRQGQQSIQSQEWEEKCCEGATRETSGISPPFDLGSVVPSAWFNLQCLPQTVEYWSHLVVLFREVMEPSSGEV